MQIKMNASDHATKGVITATARGVIVWRGAAADGFVDMLDDPSDPENMIDQTSKAGRAMLATAQPSLARKVS